MEKPAGLIACWRIAFWSAMLGVLVFSLMPSDVPMPTTGWDKSNHLLGFAMLAMLGAWAYPQHMGRVVMSLPGYGALIEVLQGLTSYRSAQWSDLLADVLGIMLGTAVAMLVRRKFPRGT